MYNDLVHKRSDMKAMPPRCWTKYRRHVQAEWYKICTSRMVQDLSVVASSEWIMIKWRILTKLLLACEGSDYAVKVKCTIYNRACRSSTKNVLCL